MLRRTLFAAAALIAPAALAFHDGNVGECEGCHTMHNSAGGRAISRFLTVDQTGPSLLQGNDQSSTCLNCHDSPNAGLFHVSTDTGLLTAGSPPINYTPGGDFGWLKKAYSWTAHGATQNSLGERHGHNVIAVDYGYVQDQAHQFAPGGDTFNYPSANLTCISCHDPHGRYRLNADNGVFSTTGSPIDSSGSYGTLPTSTLAVGSYRLLAGVGYQPRSLQGSFAFAFPPPIAVAPITYNQAETDNSTTTGQVIVAYGKDMSLFCANCHALMHSTFGSVVHPADQALGADVAQVYASYKKTGDVTGSSNGYWSLVPVQHDNLNTIAALSTFVGKNANPVSTDRVMCLSCHRAHASGFDSAMRFNTTYEMITAADSSNNPIYPDPAVNANVAQGRTPAEQQAAYWGRPATVWAIYQRDLCNKCHAKD